MNLAPARCRLHSTRRSKSTLAATLSRCLELRLIDGPMMLWSVPSWAAAGGRAGCDSSVGFANERMGKARSQQFHADFRGPALKVALSSQMRQSQFFFRLQLIECPVASSLLQRVSLLIHLSSPTQTDNSRSCSCRSCSSAPNCLLSPGAPPAIARQSRSSRWAVWRARWPLMQWASSLPLQELKSCRRQ